MVGVSQPPGRGVQAHRVRREAAVGGVGTHVVVVEPPAFDDGLASASEAKTSSLRHSSRKRPLKLSTKPLSGMRFPGAAMSGCFWQKRRMVSPSGTRGAGSTKVRAGRR